MDTLIPNELIETKILIIRGKKVMLDRDLAMLYGIKAYRLREQVKRNIEKFPEDFMFKLTESETNTMVSQNAIPSKQVLGGTLPYAFTEYGALMIANILKSTQATKVSILIVRTFVKMRELISSNIEITKKLNKLESKYNEHDKQISTIFNSIRILLEPVTQNKNKIGFIKE